MITSDIVLTHYDPDLPVKLACDSSSYGLGTVISHVMENGEERPIAFASRTLNSAEKKICTDSERGLGYRVGRKEILLLSFWTEIHTFNGSSATDINLRCKERYTCNSSITYAT